MNPFGGRTARSSRLHPLKDVGQYGLDQRVHPERNGPIERCTRRGNGRGAPVLSR
jgi:hypothetical protein